MLDTHFFTACIRQNHTEANGMASESEQQVFALQWDQSINRCGPSIQMEDLSKLAEKKQECLALVIKNYMEWDI